MTVDLTKPVINPEMRGSEMKDIRAKLSLSATEFGRAFGYTGTDATVKMVIHRYESDGRSIPPWLARLTKMFERHGVPPEFIKAQE